MSALTQPIKWFGGKHYLAPKIIALFPRHRHYVEPYFGGGAVLLARDPADESLWIGSDGSNRGVSEIVNDLDNELTNFWRVLASSALFPHFLRVVEAIPLSRPEFDQTPTRGHLSYNGHAAVDDAVAFFVNCRQSRAGMRKDFTSLTRNRTRRGMNGNVSEWLGAVDGLADVHARLRRVVVENLDAVTLIKREDTPETLYYCDPPYVHDTRTAGGYAHEMNETQHAELLNTLAALKGKFLLSGYRSELYDSFAALHGWQRVDWDLPNNAAGGDSKRRMTESCWTNYTKE